MIFTLLACTPASSDSLGSPGIPDSTSAEPQASQQQSSSTIPAVTLPDLDQTPLYWFAPLPPMPTGEGRPFIGSEDFMALFEPDAPWQVAASHLSVFKLYGEWVAYHASAAQLEQVVQDIRRRGFALAVEVGPLNATSECGQGIEGFAGHDEGRLIADRIIAAGGTIDVIALDEPLYFAHFYDGSNACNYSIAQIAAEVDEYIQLMRSFFPNVIVGDTEPLPQPVDPQDYAEWLLTFREVNGYDLAFLHMDIDWSRTNWPVMVKQIEDFGQDENIPVGIIYNGNWGDPSDEVWLSISGERVKDYELGKDGAPAHVVFQSWNDHPDFVLPESGDFTYTNFITQYFEDKASLGYATDGFGANLGFGKSTRVSRYLEGNEGELAVDGDLGTLWSSGDSPTQWIEIDLGEAANIAEIRLVPAQYPAGETIHRVYLRGTGTDQPFELVHTFQGFTEDSVALSFVSADPLVEVRFVRVETISSPSWVAWREIEILSASE
jgi:hypothetical protein